MLLATYVIDYLGRVSIKTPLKSMATCMHPFSAINGMH